MMSWWSVGASVWVLFWGVSACLLARAESRACGLFEGGAS